MITSPRFACARLAVFSALPRFDAPTDACAVTRVCSPVSWSITSASLRIIPLTKLPSTCVANVITAAWFTPSGAPDCHRMRLVALS